VAQPNPDWLQNLISRIPAYPGHRASVNDRLKDLFFAQLPNENTRAAYASALRYFFHFCEANAVMIEEASPRLIAAWLKTAGKSPRTQRVYLAAVRRFYNELGLAGILKGNPATIVRLERLDIREGATSVFEPQELNAFFASQVRHSLLTLRNVALFRTLFHQVPRVSAVVNLRVGDYHARGNVYFLRLKEKRGKINSFPVHPRAREALDDWLSTSGLSGSPDAPLFPRFSVYRDTLFSTPGPDGRPIFQPLNRRAVYRLIRRITANAGIQKKLGCHSFRATGITFFLKNGGSVEIAQRFAQHRDRSTTDLYDRRGDDILQDEIVRIDLPRPTKKSS
jgi:integrase/recombinase XerD